MSVFVKNLLCRFFTITKRQRINLVAQERAHSEERGEAKFFVVQNRPKIQRQGCRYWRRQFKSGVSNEFAQYHVPMCLSVNDDRNILVQPGADHNIREHCVGYGTAIAKKCKKSLRSKSLTLFLNISFD